MRVCVPVCSYLWCACRLQTAHTVTALEISFLLFSFHARLCVCKRVSVCVALHKHTSSEHRVRPPSPFYHSTTNASHRNCVNSRTVQCDSSKPKWRPSEAPPSPLSLACALLPFSRSSVLPFSLPPQRCRSLFSCQVATPPLRLWLLPFCRGEQIPLLCVFFPLTVISTVPALCSMATPLCRVDLVISEGLAIQYSLRLTSLSHLLVTLSLHPNHATALSCPNHLCQAQLQGQISFLSLSLLLSPRQFGLRPIVPFHFSISLPHLSLPSLFTLPILLFTTTSSSSSLILILSVTSALGSSQRRHALLCLSHHQHISSSHQPSYDDPLDQEGKLV